MCSKTITTDTTTHNTARLAAQEKESYVKKKIVITMNLKRQKNCEVDNSSIVIDFLSTRAVGLDS